MRVDAKTVRWWAFLVAQRPSFRIEFGIPVGKVAAAAGLAPRHEVNAAGGVRWGRNGESLGLKILKFLNI